MGGEAQDSKDYQAAPMINILGPTISYFNTSRASPSPSLMAKDYHLARMTGVLWCVIAGRMLEFTI